MRVRHARGEYEVRFCPLADALADLGPAPWTITDEKVAAALAPVLPEGGERIAVGPGERSKSLATYERCVRWLSDQGADRNATIIALGGGVVGDLAGFVAATYMRGVRLIQIPTSLMAQVDSAIGGKVALDLQQGKNLIGSFHAPAEVRIAVEALATLEPRHFVNGMAEVLKYGFILEPHLVEVCLRDTLHAGHAELEAIVRRCVELKAHVVQEDEFEVAGTRAILNFGHTIGHAVEAATGYGPILHGEAVAIGMVVEAVLGERIGITELGVAAQVRIALETYGLPTRLTGAAPSALIDAIRRDKKRRGGALAFSLLTRIGECKLVSDVPESEVLGLMNG